MLRIGRLINNDNKENEYESLMQSSKKVFEHWNVLNMLKRCFSDFFSKIILSIFCQLWAIFC